MLSLGVKRGTFDLLKQLTSSWRLSQVNQVIYLGLRRSTASAMPKGLVERAQDTGNYHGQ